MIGAWINAPRSDPERMNSNRADWAEAALTAFRKATGADAEYGEDIADLICDLLHAADCRGLNPATVIERAVTHYRYETGRDGEANPKPRQLTG